MWASAYCSDTAIICHLTYRQDTRRGAKYLRGATVEQIAPKHGAI